MPYIAFDLDALASAPDVARAAGVPEDSVVAGLTRMWAWCWRAKSEYVEATQLLGFFGGSDVSRLSDALVAFGFLEVLENKLRVRGADRYLRLDEARRKGGLAAKKNLIPGGPKARLQPSSTPAPAEQQPTPTLGSTSALSLSIEHRALNINKSPIATRSVASRLDEAVVPENLIQLKPAKTKADEVFDHWRSRLGKGPNAKFRGKRQRNVEARLKDGYSVEDLKLAIDGCALTPHNMGSNERGERYDDLELICRGVEQVERFMANARAPPKGPFRDVRRGTVRAEDQAHLHTEGADF